MSSIDQQFVEYIVKSLVSNPDAVQVERRIDEKGVLLELTVDGEDLGRVIGKRGATAQSLRTLLRALGTKNDARYNLKIIDPSGGALPAVVADSPVPGAKSADDRASTTSIADDLGLDDDEVVSKKDDPKDNSEDGSDENDVVSKTRRELEDLDDLDV